MGSVQQHVGEVKYSAKLSVVVHLKINLSAVNHVPNIQVGDEVLIMCLILI